MKYHIFILGCQMNVNDSERIATVLDNLGFSSTSEDKADLIIANLCSVRQKAIDRIWGKLKNWQKMPKKPLVYLTGCILKGDRQKFEKRVDGIFNINAIGDPHFPTLIAKKIPSAPKPKARGAAAYFDIKPKAISHKRNAPFYIPIATGCNNFCSYCAVPYTRGREISRPANDILAEVQAAIKSGYKKILFLSQNANSYYGLNRKLKCKIGFGELLKKIDNLSGNFTYTFLSSNPHDMTHELIKIFAKLKKWDKTLHMAMQSGDDEILKKMNRKYTSAQFLKLINDLRYAIRDLRLSTDIIVGFPTESKKAFLNTVKLCKKANFEKAYISQYSPRPGTISAKMKDNIPQSEKKQRWLVLNKMINGN
jgi:tRNA-2-methylthio-N6-dimethylallyladenosine synthase